MSQAGALPTDIVLPPDVPLTFTGNSGSGSAVANNFDIVGTGTISTIVVGDTLTISSDILVASGTLTSAQVKALHGTPVQVIAAQGVGKVICIVSSCATKNYNNTGVFVAGAGQTINLYYSNLVNIQQLLSNAAIVSASNTYNQTTPSITTAIAYASVSNRVVNLYVSSATEISGNAANDNTVSYNILYRIITIP